MPTKKIQQFSFTFPPSEWSELSLYLYLEMLFQDDANLHSHTHTRARVREKSSYYILTEFSLLLCSSGRHRSRVWWHLWTDFVWECFEMAVCWCEWNQDAGPCGADAQATRNQKSTTHHQFRWGAQICWDAGRCSRMLWVGVWNWGW